MTNTKIMKVRITKMSKTRINNLKDFINYLIEQVRNHSIYVWGGQGEDGSTITEKWIRNRENSTANADRAVSFWKRQCEAGYKNKLRAFDCSGLGAYFFLHRGYIKSDITADGLKKLTVSIKKSALQVGDFVFKTNAAGKATHIGYVVDNRLNVIEARGRDAGVVMSPLSEGGWDSYGRCVFWTELELAQVQGRYQFSRVLKFGSSGDDVCDLKKLLRLNGFDGLTVTNRFYFATTKKIVKQAQKALGLTVDGKVGKQTVTALGGVWRETN